MGNAEKLNELYTKMVQSNETGTEEVVNEPTESTDDSEEIGSSDSTEETQEVEVIEDSVEVDNESQETVEDTEASTDPQEVDNDEDVEIFDDWDSVSTETLEPSQTNDLDYSELSKELGLEISNREQLALTVKKLQEKSEKEPDYSELPQKLQEAVKLAKEGQDFEELFKAPEGVVDHKLYDDEMLLVNQYAEIFKDDSGKVNEEELREYIDEMSDTQRKVEARKIRVDLDRYNQSLVDKRDQEVIAERQMAEQKLKSAVEGFDGYSGFKATPNHKKDIFNAISTGKAAEELFYDANGNYDFNKICELYFIKTNFEKMKSFLVNKAKNQTRKQDFENISNANVEGPRQEQVGVGEAPKKGKLDIWLEELQSKHKLN